MKLSLTLPVILVALDGTSGSKSPATKKLIQNARRVEYNYHYNNNEGYSGGNYGGTYGNANGGNYGGGNGGNYGGQGGDADAKEAWYLTGYSLKMLSCQQGEQSMNYREGKTESSTVIFRLCPSDTCGADNSSVVPCEEGYGDFAVGIDTFAQAYVEAVKDNYNSGMQYYSYDYGEFNVEEYVGECKLFEGGEGEGNNQYQNNYNYDYIGAACTSDGTDIKLTSFSDPYCTTESDASFESTHNGFALPYKSGGLVPSTCMSCMKMNDNYEYEINEMCQQVYENTNYKCEEKMESYNTYYGPDTRGCEYLESYVPKSSRTSWSSSNKGSESSGRKFFKGAVLAGEYVALLIISGLLGAAAVGYFFKEKIVKNTKGPGEAETEETSVVESIKSAAMLIKVMVFGIAAKIVEKARNFSSNKSSEEDYNNMEMDSNKYTRPEEEHC